MMQTDTVQEAKDGEAAIQNPENPFDVFVLRGTSFARLIQLLFLRALVGLADLLDGNFLLCAMLIVACFFPLALLESHSNLLTNDEIYTVHISQAPTIRDMLGLAREIDLHPPMHYLAEREALHMPLPRWFAARLPSILAGLVVCFAVFWYSASRVGKLFGMVAVAVFWFCPALDFTWSNRPYMLWLMWLSLLMLARDIAVRIPRPRWALPLVFCLSLGMVTTHLLGIACIGPFWVAELVRARERKRIDWALLAAYTLPALLGLGSYYQIHHVGQNAFPEFQLPSMDLIMGLYVATFGNTIVILTGCMMALVAIFGRDSKTLPQDVVVRQQGRDVGFSRQDGALLVTLLVLPLGLLIPSAILHIQFWLRYGAASMPAWAAISVWIVARKLPLARLVAIVTIVCSIGYMGYRMHTESGPQGNANYKFGGRLPMPLWKLDPNLPLVVASPMTFMEMSDREPLSISHRVYYLTDRDAAFLYAHYTLFENEDKIRDLMHLPSQVEALTPFLAEHKQFYVLGNYNVPQVWLLRKLADSGIKLVYLGKYQSTYENDDLYIVTQ